MFNAIKKHLDSFTSLNYTQFLGALNDNVFKFLIVYFLNDLKGAQNSPTILAKAGAIFVIPFLLFSTASGKLADNFSKRSIIVITKILEVIIMTSGVIFFALESEAGSYFILFLMATQSAIFSPSKYGIVPELVEYEDLSKANGLLTTFTFLAIIIGTFLASFITEITSRNFILAASVCVMISIAGLACSLFIEFTPPTGYKRKISTFFLADVYKSIVSAKRHNRLFSSILGSAFFLFMGAYLQLNIIPFAIQSLKLTDVQGGYLFLITALGIGTGSYLAGKLSGKHVELGLVPISGIGMVITTIMLYFCANHLSFVIPLVIIVGVFGGIWIVPCDSYIQACSPEHARGQMVATTNFLGFIGVLGASVFLYVLSDVLKLQAYQGFLFISFLTLLATIAFTWATLDFFLRFFSYVFSKLFFRLNVLGQGNVPSNSPCLILCNRPSSIIDTILLMSIQKPPLRFFLESERYENKIIRNLCKLLRIVLIPPQISMEAKKFVFQLAKRGLDKGYTVCIFANTDEQDVMDQHLDDFHRFIEQSQYFILPVTIDESTLHPSSGRIVDLLKEFPWRVSISFGSLQQR